MPEFQKLACGNSASFPSNPVQPVAVPTIPPSCIPTTIISTTTSANIVQFVLDLANKYSFPGENLNNFVRFGVIQFSDDATATIPLGNWSRSEFENQVQSNIVYDDGGVSNVKSAFLAALAQFQQNSILNNRAIILIVNDISMFSIGDSMDALSQLKQYVNLPMGAIVPGFWGTPQDALSHLTYLLGNRTDLAFASLNDALNGIPNFIDLTYPCPILQPCSALIFIEEATEAIGYPNKVQFLQLVQKLVATTNFNRFKRCN
uniref:VWFA domain-containing protein n=1 Tax=Panagrolaimus sp. ES5 TaxID=591445 RepID=A0AC34F2U3_9BILA